MNRRLLSKILLWWSFNNPKTLYKVYTRNKSILRNRILNNIPINFHEIENQFNNVTEP